MLQELSLYMYVWVLICTEDAYHVNTMRYRQEGGSKPTDSRGGPPQIQKVAPTTHVVWHFLHVALCSEG